MSVGGGASLDPYWLYEISNVMISRQGRTAVDIASNLGAGTGIYIISGQSNAQNISPTPYVPTNGNAIFDYNIYDGCLYPSAAPHLGCSGSSGDNWPWVFADKLITAATHSKVILVHVAIGGSLFADWTPSGGVYRYNNRIVCTANRLRTAGITPNAILNEMGESDAILNTASLTVTANINTIVDSWRAHGVTCKFYQSLSTWYSSANPSNVNVRTGVGNSIDHSSPRQIWLGADTDTLGASYRFDDVHWSGWSAGSGMDAVSDLWRAFF